MEFLQTFAGALEFGVLNMAWIFIVLLGIERLWPKGPVTLESQLRSLKFWVFYAVAGALIVTCFAYAKRALPGQPLYVAPVKHWIEASPFAWAIYILGPLAGMAVYDFFNYWMHRAQHKWFWAQHSIHHSIENVSALNSYFHWSEDLFRTAFISAPMLLLFNINHGGGTLAVAMLSMMHGNYLHSATSLNFGRFGRMILADNRWHRIHHSVEPQHFDRNFATALPIWDVLFGTARFPKPGEWPATGVHDTPEAKTVSEVLWRPFRRATIAGKPLTAP